MAFIVSKIGASKFTQDPNVLAQKDENPNNDVLLIEKKIETDLLNNNQEDDEMILKTIENEIDEIINGESDDKKQMCLDSLLEEHRAIKRQVASEHINRTRITLNDENKNEKESVNQKAKEEYQKAIEEIEKAEQEKIEKELENKAENNDDFPEEVLTQLQQVLEERKAVERQLAPELINQTKINLD